MSENDFPFDNPDRIEDREAAVPGSEREGDRPVDLSRSSEEQLDAIGNGKRYPRAAPDSHYAKAALEAAKGTLAYTAINFPPDAPNAIIKNSKDSFLYLFYGDELEDFRKYLKDTVDDLTGYDTFMEKGLPVHVNNLLGFAVIFSFFKDLVEGIVNYTPESSEDPVTFAKTNLAQELARNGLGTMAEKAKAGGFDKVLDVIVKQTTKEVTGNTSLENLSDENKKLINAKVYARLKAFCNVLYEAKFDERGFGFLPTPEGKIGVDLNNEADVLTALGVTRTFKQSQLQRSITQERKKSTEYLEKLNETVTTTIAEAGLTQPQFDYIMNTILNGSVKEETVLGSIAGITSMQYAATRHIYDNLLGKVSPNEDFDDEGNSLQTITPCPPLDYLASVDITKFLSKGATRDQIDAFKAEKLRLVQDITEAKAAITDANSYEQIAAYMQLIEKDLPAFCAKVGMKYPNAKHFFKEGAYDMIKVLKTDAINSAIEKAIASFEVPQKGQLSQEVYTEIMKGFTQRVEAVREQKNLLLTSPFNSEQYSQSINGIYSTLYDLKTYSAEKGIIHADPFLVLQNQLDVESRQITTELELEDGLEPQQVTTTHPSNATSFIGHVAIKNAYRSFAENLERRWKGENIAPNQRKDFGWFLQGAYDLTRWKQGRGFGESVGANLAGIPYGLGRFFVDSYTSNKNPLHFLQAMSPWGFTAPLGLNNWIPGFDAPNIINISTPLHTGLAGVDVGYVLSNAGLTVETFKNGLTGRKAGKPIEGAKIHEERVYAGEDGSNLANDNPQGKSKNPFYNKGQVAKELEENIAKQLKKGKLYLFKGEERGEMTEVLTAPEPTLKKEPEQKPEKDLIPQATTPPTSTTEEIDRNAPVLATATATVPETQIPPILATATAVTELEKEDITIYLQTNYRYWISGNKVFYGDEYVAREVSFRDVPAQEALGLITNTNDSQEVMQLLLDRARELENGAQLWKIQNNQVLDDTSISELDQEIEKIASGIKSQGSQAKDNETTTNKTNKVKSLIENPPMAAGSSK